MKILVACAVTVWGLGAAASEPAFELWLKETPRPSYGVAVPKTITGRVVVV